MKKRLLLLALILGILPRLHAQTAAPVSGIDVPFNGHIIRVYQTSMDAYGYDVFYQNRLVIHQNNNPFTGAPGGLKTKDDALKIAKWQVLHLNQPGRRTIPNNRTVPREVAHQLKIATN